jgi:hypothetical protein
VGGARSSEAARSSAREGVLWSVPPSVARAEQLLLPAASVPPRATATAALLRQKRAESRAVGGRPPEPPPAAGEEADPHGGRSAHALGGRSAPLPHPHPHHHPHHFCALANSASLLARPPARAPARLPQVRFVRPVEEENAEHPWFNVFALHQNRDYGRGAKSCVHESFLPEWLVSAPRSASGRARGERAISERKEALGALARLRCAQQRRVLCRSFGAKRTASRLRFQRYPVRVRRTRSRCSAAAAFIRRDLVRCCSSLGCLHRTR